jgi:ornithine lipid ester-linked acyl 2-hydroxylase
MELKVTGIPLRRIIQKLGVPAAIAFTVMGMLRHVYELPIWLFSRVGRGPFFADENFPWLAGLQQAAPAIRAELDAVLASNPNIPAFHEIAPDQAVITEDKKWQTYFLLIYANWVEKNRAACPQTVKAIEQIPGLRTAMFSILEPHKHIPPHNGPYNGVLRLHMGLIVPKQSERCRIRVDKEVRHWEVGHTMVFDDTFEHEVWNDTEERRVVLFLDLERPLPPLVARYNRALLKAIARSPVILGMADNAQHM